ncbi:TRAP transporter substrate-binding protein [Polaromonas naphthalenivorans]|uniref:TRAP dicarboxylate transporter, DctP subunit n=1 Tax=Polaromonas naphthalenivorans (strain CJ2) TaxID=365044 RepID=A1VUK4_POLNA|nr:TRAP transporter substrate-binding protein [Polaromonas naphthalenivorans]ABM39332.1 TRAP dicarboxylate transporter, DctP subunit [Polaromonas naphthalenivorans CJ2]
MQAIRFTLIAALAAFAASAVAAHAGPITLTFSHGTPTTHPEHVAALQFARRVEERTHGQIKFAIFPAGQLGSENEVLEKVRLGALDMAASTQNYLIKYEKAFAVITMPYVFDNYAHAHRVLDGPAMAWLAPLAKKQGFVMLSNWEWGFRNLTNNQRPINQPGDVRGLKIRVPPVLGLEATMQALGAQISKISFKDLYAALSQGRVDGQENPLNVIYYNKLYEVQKHLALTRHVYYNQVHLMGAKSWARLTPAQQTIVREESKAAGDGARKAIIAEEDELIAKMAAAGVKVTRPDPQPFRAMMEPAHQKIKLLAGEENARKFLNMVADERRP